MKLNCIVGDAAVVWWPGSGAHGHIVDVIYTLVPGRCYEMHERRFQAPAGRTVHIVESKVKYHHRESGRLITRFPIYDDLLRSLCGPFGKESPSIYDVSPTKYMESK